MHLKGTQSHIESHLCLFCEEMRGSVDKLFDSEVITLSNYRKIRPLEVVLFITHQKTRLG